MPDPSRSALPTLEEAYEPWLGEAGVRARRLSPDEELLAEHHVMGGVLLGMEAALEQMKGGRPLRPAFWADVVDFNGNFVHMCHRVKEEQHLFPAMIDAGIVPAANLQGLDEEHTRARGLTLALRDGVEQGDWEKVLRVVVLHVHVLRGHMRAEEVLFRSVRGVMSEETTLAVRAGFDRVEAEALGAPGRAHFLGIARRIISNTGVRYDLT